LTDFRIDLAQYLKAYPGALESLPLGVSTVTTTNEAEIAAGIIFCLCAEGAAVKRSAEAGYPLEVSREMACCDRKCIGT
jgi:hypothetical protein